MLQVLKGSFKIMFELCSSYYLTMEIFNHPCSKAAGFEQSMFKQIKKTVSFLADVSLN